jgi:hypothetical protein
MDPVISEETFTMTRTSTRLIALFAVLALAAADVLADVCRVTTDGSSIGQGSDWTDQAMDLHTALGDAGCSEIWLKAGVYRPVVPADPENVTEAEREVSFTIDRQVGIYGGFDGTESDRDDRDPVANTTVLSGDIDDNDTVNSDGVTEIAPSHINGNNSYHVVWIDGTTSSITDTTVIDGLIITAGLASSTTSVTRGSGGGVHCTSLFAGSACSPAFNNVTFSGNFARWGAAMYNRAPAEGVSSPMLSNVTFSGNSASEEGALYNLAFNGGESSPVLSNVTFSGNVGIAIYNRASQANSISDPVLVNVTFSGNTAADNAVISNAPEFGGSITMTLANVIVWGNTTVSPGGSDIRGAGGTISYSIVQGGCPADFVCDNLINTNPQLGGLADNGGFTRTRLPGIGSVAIDAGDNDSCPATDQRGVPRPQGGGCDIGAVELTLDHRQNIFRDRFEE